jgi:hypothetical protein
MYSLRAIERSQAALEKSYQLTLLSLSGCVKNGAIYIVSTAPLDIFNALIANGTHILWAARSGSRLTATHLSPNTCVLVYSGSLADQVADENAWVVLVTITRANQVAATAWRTMRASGQALCRSSCSQGEDMVRSRILLKGTGRGNSSLCPCTAARAHGQHSDEVLHHG